MPKLQDTPLFCSGGTRSGPFYLVHLFSLGGRFPFQDYLSRWTFFKRLRSIICWRRRAWRCLQPVSQTPIFCLLQRRRGCQSILQGTLCPPRRRRDFCPLRLGFESLRPHLLRQTCLSLQWPALLLAFWRAISCMLSSSRPMFYWPHTDLPSRCLLVVIFQW